MAPTLKAIRVEITVSTNQLRVGKVGLPPLLLAKMPFKLSPPSHERSGNDALVAMYLRRTKLVRFQIGGV